MSVRFSRLLFFITLLYLPFYAGCPSDTNVVENSNNKDEASLVKERKKIQRMIQTQKNGRAKAIQIYQDLSKKRPESPLYHYLFGYALVNRQKKWNEFNHCLRRDPRYFWCLIGRGRVYVGWGILDQAERDFNFAKKLRPNSVEYLVGMAMIASSKRRGQKAKAIRLYKKVLASQPGNLEVTYELAVLYEQQKEWDKSLEWYKKFLDKEPQHFDALRSVGDIYYTLKKYTDSIPYLERAFKLKARFKLCTRLAFLYESLSRYNKALVLYEKATRMPQAQFNVYMRYGTLLAKSEQDDKAIQILKEAHKLNRNHNGVLIKLGGLYLKKNNPTEAVKVLKIVLKRERLDTNLRYLLATAHYKKGEYADSLHHYDKILQLDAKNTKARAAMRKLLDELGLSDKKYSGSSNQAVLRRAKSYVVRCYKTRLRKKPKLKGKIKLSLDVYPEGVRKVRFDPIKTTIDDKILRACVKWTFRRAQFPRIKKPVRFRYSFKLGR